MGFPKALLADPDGRPFVARVARTLMDAGLTDVAVVTGVHHAAIEDALVADGLRDRLRLLRNPDPSRGQLSSIWTALEAAGGVDALLITLVDVPLLATSTVRAVVEAWQAARPPIVRPIVGGRRGHPVIFDRALFDELREAPLDAGARLVVRAHWSESVDVPVADEGCLMDVDTPTDYERVQRLNRSRS